MAHEWTVIENVDDDFLTRLNDIQSYCSSLKSSNRDDIRLCREWLKKLYTTDEQRDTTLKNAYLSKLWEQLKSGELKEPFDKLPKDDEPLAPLTTARRADNDDDDDDCKIHQDVGDEIHQIGRTHQVSQTHGISQTHQSIQTLNASSVEDTSSENTQTQAFVSDLFNSPVTVIVHKHETDRKCPSEKTDDISIKESFNGGKILDTIAACSNLKQWKKESPENNSEAGDGLVFVDRQAKLKLVLIEKLFDEIKITSEIHGEQEHLYADKNTFNNQIFLVSDKLKSVKNEINEKLCEGMAIDESENDDKFKTLADKYTEIDDHLGQVILEIKHLKTMVEEACGNKTNMNDTLEVLEYIKELHCLQITENERRFGEQISKLEDENGRLRSRAEVKSKGVHTFNDPRANTNLNQNRNIDSLKNSLKRIEEYMDDKLSIMIPYVKKLENANYQLEVVNESQRKVLSQLNNKLKEMNKPSETREMQNLICLLLQYSA